VPTIIHTAVDRTHIHGALIRPRVDDPPHGGPRGGHHGDDAPVGAEVLNAPDDGDDDGDEGEGAAVAGADEGGAEVEEARVVQRQRGREEEEAQREEEGAGEEEGHAGEGYAGFSLRLGEWLLGGWVLDVVMRCAGSEDIRQRARQETGDGRCQGDGGDMRRG